MANLIYPKFKEALLGGDLAVGLDAADIRALAVDAADYTYSAAHDFLDDIPGGAIVAVSAAIGGISITNGVFDLADFVFEDVTGDEFEYVIFYQHDGGADSARRLIALFDTATGLALTPNGLDVNVAINASGLFAL